MVIVVFLFGANIFEVNPLNKSHYLTQESLAVTCGTILGHLNIFLVAFFSQTMHVGIHTCM